MGLPMERRFWKWLIFAFFSSALNMSTQRKITDKDRQTKKKQQRSGKPLEAKLIVSVIYKIEQSK